MCAGNKCAHTNTKLNPDNQWAKPRIYLNSWVHHQQQLQPLACLINRFAGSSCRLNTDPTVSALTTRPREIQLPQRSLARWGFCGKASTLPLGCLALKKINDKTITCFCSAVCSVDFSYVWCTLSQPVFFDVMRIARNSEHVNKRC